MTVCKQSRPVFSVSNYLVTIAKQCVLARMGVFWSGVVFLRWSSFHQKTALCPSSLAPPERSGSRVICSVLWCRHGVLAPSGKALMPPQLFQPTSACHLTTVLSPPPGSCWPPPVAPLLCTPSIAQWSVLGRELLTQAGRGNKLTCG